MENQTESSCNGSIIIWNNIYDLVLSISDFKLCYKYDVLYSGKPQGHASWLHSMLSLFIEVSISAAISWVLLTIICF